MLDFHMGSFYSSNLIISWQSTWSLHCFPFPWLPKIYFSLGLNLFWTLFFFSLKKLDDSFVIQVQKFRKSRFSPRSGSLSTGFQGPSTYLILELELLTSATLEGHCRLLHPTGRLLQELRAPSRSPLSYTPPSSPSPLHKSPPDGWEGIQPNILQPHTCLHSASSPRRLCRSCPPEDLPDHPQGPPLLSHLSHARTCTIWVPLISTSHYENFTEKRDFKCHNILKLNKNKPTKCSRSNWQLVVQSLSCAQLSATPWPAAPQASQSFTVSQALRKLSNLHSNVYRNEPTTTYFIAQELYSVIIYKGKESEKEDIYTYIYTHTHVYKTESLCWTPETNKTL